MRRILHVYRDGKYAAIDNPGAVVVDYDAKMIRVGLDRWPVARPSVMKFLAFMLRSADVVQHYPAITAAVGTSDQTPACISKIAYGAEPFLLQIGMTLETVETIGFRLHTDPRSTLECCKTIALGQPLPSRVKSIRVEHGAMFTTPVPLPPLSTRRSRPSAKTRSASRTMRL
jgi:hypothetical protein